MSCFQENLELLAERNALLAWEVRGCTPMPWTPPRFEVGEGVQCLFGVALTKPKGPLVLIDPDPARWHAWLSLPEATALLKNPDVHFHAIDDQLFVELMRKFASHKIEVHSTEEHPLFATVKKRLLEENATFSRMLDEVIHYSDLFYDNFYANLQELHRAHLASDLFGRYKGVPAVICGGGPSLDPNVLTPDRALILAAGSAFKKVGHLAHFGVGLDPHHHQQDRFQNANVPIFYRSRWNKGAVKATNQLLYLNSDQPIDRWVERKLGIAGKPLDAGKNVVCLAVEVAKALGCDPIIFVGMDLAYTDGVVTDPDPVIEMDGLKTHWKWVSESRWISEHAKGATFYNATGAGLGFEGIPNVPYPDLPPCKIPPMPKLPTIDTSELPSILQELKESCQRCEKMLDLPPSPLVEVELEEEVAFDAILEFPASVCKWLGQDPKPILRKALGWQP